MGQAKQALSPLERPFLEDVVISMNSERELFAFSQPGKGFRFTLQYVSMQDGGVVIPCGGTPLPFLLKRIGVSDRRVLEDYLTDLSKDRFSYVNFVD